MDRNEHLGGATRTCDSRRDTAATDSGARITRHRVPRITANSQPDSRRRLSLHHPGHLAPSLDYPTLYFAYGSNLNHDQMRWRCPTARFVKRIDLRGWQLAFGTHATVLPRRGARVPGALWLVQPKDFQALDRYEGYPIYYTRRRWRQDNDHFFFYEIAGPAQGTPSSGYIQGILEGYQDCGIIEPQWSQNLAPYITSSIQSRYDYI